MTWRAAQAKAQFSEVLDRAETEGPQVVTRRKHSFVVLSDMEYRRLRGAEPEVKHRSLEGAELGTKPEKSLWDVLRPPPELWGDEEFPRAKGKARPVSF